jgi:hypothetical protein
VAVTALLMHFLTAPRYGYFRDEFYILACGRHLDWGYVDHAPLVALIARLTSITLGTSLYALRFVTGISAGLKAVLTALLARELGGNRFAIVLAAGSTLLVPIFLAVDNQFSLNTWEPLFWMATLLALMVSLRKQQPRLLLWAGLTAGLGIENKHSALFFLLALTAALLLSPQRRLFRGPYIYGAALLAGLLALPNFVWQVAHDFPTLRFLQGVNSTHKNVELPPWKFLFAQLMMLNIVNALLWLPGLYLLLRRKQFRFLGLTYLLLTVLLMLLHGKDYYLAPIYPLLFAAGSVFWSTSRYRRWVPAVLIVAAIPVFPVVLPILPPDEAAPYMRRLGIAPNKTETVQEGPLPQYFGDEFGWPETAAAVARVYSALPSEERAQTAIYTGSYGDAGSLEHYGAALHLPRVLSAHNNYWYWGQGATAQTLILVNSERLIREGHCSSVTDGPEVGHPLSMTEDRFRIRVCHGLKQPLPELWPTLKHWS